MNPEWAHDLFKQAGIAGVPFFFKKFGDGEPQEVIDWANYPWVKIITTRQFPRR